ncbi:MAG: hypothetical protein WBL65_18285 [Bryobacteraceae bacterium]
MEDNNTTEDIVDLGAWLGRKQAFTLIAGRCSAATVVCLRKIREGKRYRALGLTWEQFCRQRAGISRAFADKVILQLEQLGPAWFELSSVTRITPDQFRQIAGAVTDEGLSYAGEPIEIVPENAHMLAQAIEILTSTPDSEPDTPERTFARAERSLRSALAGLERLAAMPLDIAGQEKLSITLAAARNTLERISLSVRV